MKRLFHLTLFFILFLELLPVSAAEQNFPYSFTGTVLEVIEGDLLRVLHQGKSTSVRLSDVDCPEVDQAFFMRAKQFSVMLVFSGPVTVKVKGLDIHGIAVGEVTLLDKGLNLNKELVKAGLAWWQMKKSDDPSYGDLEKKAREMKIGLWKARDPIPPWEFHIIKGGT